MIRFRRSLVPVHVLVVLLLATSGSPDLASQGGSTLNGHPVKLDAGGNLLAWGPVQDDAYDQVLGLSANFLLNGVPTASNGKKLYYSESYALPGNPITPAGWPHNPAGLYSMLTDSGLAFYAYSGNAAMTNLVRDVLTHQLDHGMTPSTWLWPGVAYASGDPGSLTYRGAQYGNSNGVGDGVGVIQPDKVGEIGVAFLKYYEFSGAVRFRDAAVQAANVLASHVRPGNATQSPWPFRVYAENNVIREQYSAHVISPIQLFDELIRLNLGDVPAYQAARQTAWTWLMTYPMQNNVWANYFEDVPIKSDRSNVNQLNAAETARYLMQHPEFDPNWETHVRGIIAWIEATFAQRQYGANTINEQMAFFYPMGSHTSRYASINAQLFELTGDQAAREKAYRSLNWATYMCGSNGVVIDGPGVNHIWWTDGYGDYIKHFLAGLGSVPEWAPPGQTHLLRSTSVVRSIQYGPTEVNYQVFDGSAQEVLRLNFTPRSVTADGLALEQRADLTQQGWTFIPATGVLRVRHDSGTQLRISVGPTTDNLPPVVSLIEPGPGTYTTSTLALTAAASDPDGAISRVDFFRNGMPLATTTTAPYSYTWTSVPAGSYQLAATATDDQGATATSAPVQVVVSAPAPPAGPTNLVATFAAGDVSLTWSPPAGGPGVSAYNIHRSNTSYFTPAANNLVAQTASPPFLDRNLPYGTYYYRVVAVDASGTPTAPSNQAAVSIGGSLAVDKVVFSDGTGARTTPAFTTGFAGEVLIAFAASSGGQPLTVSGAGLTWTLVRRANVQAGTSEIWRATAAGVLTNVTVRAADSSGNYYQSLTVVTFKGAAGSGASAGAGASSGPPTVTLTTTQPGSVVYAVGNDWDGAVGRTLPGNQALVHQYLGPAGDTMWVQNRLAAIPGAGTTVQMNATAPTNHQWNLAAVEILPASWGTPTVSVPNVVNQTQAAATALITAPDVGLVVGTVTPASSSTVPSGSVISQSPAAGTPVAAGSAVSLVVSTGPPLVNVPNVVNETQAAATALITAPSVGLVVGTVTPASSSTVPSGSVISQSPVAGTPVAAGSAVNLVVSTGPPLVNVPNVVNQTQAAATALITAPSVGLVVGTVTPAASPTVPIGSVISQSPVAGTPVARGSAVNLTVSTGPAGLVAALAFDENTGTSVADSSSSGNAGTTSGTTWTTGPFGSALNFNGVSARVTIPDTNSLDLTAAMTLEAWVRPTSLNDWTTIILKETPTGLSYGLYASDNSNRPPAGYVSISGDNAVIGPAELPLNTWSHLAMTYNGSSMRLYVNGALVATRAQTGNTMVSTGVLRIGGNGVWGEYFNGAIDEVRIYNRALSAAEIQSDMNTRIRP